MLLLPVHDPSSHVICTVHLNTVHLSPMAQMTAQNTSLQVSGRVLSTGHLGGAPILSGPVYRQGPALANDE